MSSLFLDVEQVASEYKTTTLAVKRVIALGLLPATPRGFVPGINLAAGPNAVINYAITPANATKYIEDGAKRFEMPPLNSAELFSSKPTKLAAKYLDQLREAVAKRAPNDTTTKYWVSNYDDRGREVKTEYTNKSSFELFQEQILKQAENNGVPSVDLSDRSAAVDDAIRSILMSKPIESGLVHSIPGTSLTGTQFSTVGELLMVDALRESVGNIDLPMTLGGSKLHQFYRSPEDYQRHSMTVLNAVKARNFVTHRVEVKLPRMTGSKELETKNVWWMLKGWDILNAMSGGSSVRMVALVDELRALAF